MDKLELQFVHQEILKGIRDIFSAQRNVAQRRIYQEGKERRTKHGTGNTVRGRSGYLMKSLENPAFNVWKGELGNHAHFDYPIYIRFLDMKKHGNFKIYNRQIWGILYGETFRNIRYEFNQEVRDWVDKHLREIMNQLKVNPT